MAKKAKGIPRFVLSLTDTKTTMPGPNGDQYYSVSVGFSRVKDLFVEIHEEDGGTELNRVLQFFEDAVTKMDSDKISQSVKRVQGGK